MLHKEDCLFFHSVDLPEDTVVGHWDFRKTEAEYHGNYEFKGKRVLEIGSATGAHSFWLEAHGAEVIPYDLAPENSWDILPTYKQNLQDVVLEMRKIIHGINQGFRYCAERNGSKLSLTHGSIYNVPTELGDFDVITFGSILLHTRDPIGAVMNIASRAKESIIIMDRYPMELDLDKPLMEFKPKLGNEFPWGGWTWWWITPPVFKNLLTILGFSRFDISVSKHLHVLSGMEFELYTLAASR